MPSLLPRRAGDKVAEFLSRFPVAAIVGPRQSGKSTLALQVLQSRTPSVRLDLELPSDINRLTDAEAFLRANARALVCLDEVQRAPDLFPLIRALVDEDRRPGRFLLLGSASPAFLRQSTESLAGRIGYIDLTPFTIEEVGAAHTRNHWLRGGFPESFLALTEYESYSWREQFIRTYREVDLPSLGIDITTAAIGRLWQMLASASGALLNKAKLAEPVGVSPQTIARYLDVLEATFMIRVLRPSLVGTRKRLVKSPKVYVRDTGLLHALLGIRSMNELFGHMGIGASWESYMVEQICGSLPEWSHSFYRTSGGAEIDLVLERGGRRVAIEAKASSSPRVTRGFYEATDDLDVDLRFVVAPLTTPGAYPVGRDTIACTPDWLLPRLRDEQYVGGI